MKYLNVKNGKLEQYTSKGNPPIVLDSITGKINAMRVELDSWEGKEFENLIIELENSIDKYKMKCRLDSGYGRSLISTLSNANPSEPVELKPHMEDKKSNFFVSQNGKSLKWKYTKANPNGLPPMKEIIVNKQKVYDRTDQNDFYKNVVSQLNDSFKVPSVTNDLPF